MDNNALSLTELNNNIKKAVKSAFKTSYWIVAEISEININRTGHCYIELIEKDELSEKITAKSRATIWAYTFRMIKPYFETSTGRELSAGLKIMVNVSVEFHEIYGMSLNIIDIEPTYTIGDLAKKRLEIINRLEEEGVIAMNKELEIPVVAQKIAVISSDTAAGYGDFVNQLENNNNGYKFYYKLFPALMQGDKAEESIINALDKIYKYEDFFDVVVVIRGGGSKSDLSCFDNYWLAYNITQFPLPIISGIGHERDDTIVDTVANVKVKTPTAAAEFLISRIESFDEYLFGLQSDFVNNVSDFINEKISELDYLKYTFTPLVKQLIQSNSNNLLLYTNKLKNSINNYFQNQETALKQNTTDIHYKMDNLISDKEHNISFLMNRVKNIVSKRLLSEEQKLEIFQNTVEHSDPVHILKKGYSITYKDGELIKSARELSNQDVITTKFYKGQAKSKITELKK
ncbi:MAG: exodeoxyribonuclease VII large subunit [Bacteroidetes bacterium]|nr:MAG: exodeoxyribonuclease VII large subunit [Bacteroidota bacterium]